MTHDPEVNVVAPVKAASSPSSKSTRKQKRQQKLHEIANASAIQILESTTLSVSIAPSMASPVRLLVCSIGNPAPLTNTLHSAGHLMLSTLANTLSYPPFQKSRAHGNGLISSGSEFTLWQSSSFMNVSGVGVAAAWKQFLKDHERGGEVGLVVVHDELELKVGDVKTKKGSQSTKGHNGLKSINERLRGTEYTRIAVGIGRPESREPNAVADYVLRKISAGDKEKFLAAVGRVEEELRKLAG